RTVLVRFMRMSEMRAIRVAAPWGFDAISIIEAPEPAPGPREVLVRMRAVSLNYRDFLMINGLYGRGQPRADDVITPFSDGCGVVEAVGAEV
ncbi:alcohol dehydrogenase catalytic domain-containing protein, partial [Klebsiella pneumoniae]|uniref:alcohol dehydrogenase catalytic domain-containing protein n=1 Tax=Klebsiella pneumoniae TaxID=573 RepID=UPI003EE20386